MAFHRNALQFVQRNPRTVAEPSWLAVAAVYDRRRSRSVSGSAVVDRRYSKVSAICHQKIYGTIEKVLGLPSGWIRYAAQTPSLRPHGRGRLESELYQRVKQFRTRYLTFGNRL